MATTPAQRRTVRLVVLLSVMSAVFIGGGAYVGMMLAGQFSPSSGRLLAIVFASGGLAAAAWVIHRVAKRIARRSGSG